MITPDEKISTFLLLAALKMSQASQQECSRLAKRSSYSKLLSKCSKYFSRKINYFSFLCLTLLESKSAHEQQEVAKTKEVIVNQKKRYCAKKKE